MKSKTFLILLAVVLFGGLAPIPAIAETYPARPITIVVSLAPGSGMDTITRLYADKLSAALGTPVIVENKPGAATTLAASQVATAHPDGYTLVVLTSIALSINPTLFKQLNYDPQDLTPISLYAKSPFILVINPSLPAKTFADFVKLAKASSPPLSYASIGTGSVQHMSMEFAKQRLGFEATHLPYRAVTQSVTDLLGWPCGGELPGSRPVDPADQGREIARPCGLLGATAAASPRRAALCRGRRRKRL
jgi:tripartite-type tricarboxylate transporter receptor subunit TctC